MRNATSQARDRARKGVVGSGWIWSALGAVICIALYLRTVNPARHETLAQARAGFVTILPADLGYDDPLPVAPAGFSIVRYHAPLGYYPAIIAKPTGPREATGKYPAIIWLSGGMKNEIDGSPWAPASPEDDESASAFHKAGIVTLYPSMRGGNHNLGFVETVYGEVDDVLAAARYLAERPDIDRHRIYLGGFGIGGTLALLTAEYSADTFRAVFSFGPRSDAAEYGDVFQRYNARERELRAPGLWLACIHSPTYVIEGDSGPYSCIGALRTMEAASTNPKIHFIEASRFGHYSELALTTPVIAQKIAADTAPDCNITVVESDWAGAIDPRCPQCL